MTFTPTPEQRKVIEHHTGPMLVVAGAGSGKTTVLVERIAHLVREHGVAPEQILALTYTVNAAARMRRGVQKALERNPGGGDFNAEGLRAQNFHGYCNQLLKKHSKDFFPLEENDLKVYLNLHVKDLPLKIFSKAASPGDFIADLLDFNDRCQDDLVSADDYQEYVARLKDDVSLPLPRVGSKTQLSREEVLARCQEIADVYSYVSKLLRRKGWGTFGNMVIDAVALLRDEKVLEEERTRTRFILVDEFQDTNFGQIELVQMLGGKDANVFAVGDPDQAIYRFRGATSAAFDEFRKRFPNTSEATLSMNYRSTPPILQTAFTIIERNKMKGREPLVSGRDETAKTKGKKLNAMAPETVVAPDDVTEAKTIADEIERRQSESGCKWSDFAVLYRQHDHRTEVMTELLGRDISYDVRNTDVLAAPEVRDAVALLRVMERPVDVVSYVRVASFPRFKVDAQELKAAIASAREPQMEALLRELKNGKRVLDAIASARKKIKDLKTDAAGALHVVTKEFGVRETDELKVFKAFVAKWHGKPTTDSTELESFCQYLDCFISVGAKVTVNADGEEPAEFKNAVQLMTAHAAKGLEFKNVFVIRANSGSFPKNYKEALFEFPWELSKSRLEIDEIPGPKELHEQEERRLFYVSLTRAEDALAIYGKPHWQGKNPTGYIKELNADFALSAVIRKRNIEQSRVDLQARAETLSPVSEWVLDIPSQMSLERLKLSATAIDCYDDCGMKYWLRYEWKIPEEPAAAVQYGSVIHNVLRGYYEGVRLGKPLRLDEVLTSFRDGMESARLEDQHQLKLYLEQGTRQLTAFVESRKNRPSPNVLATEKQFEFELDDVTVKGRMDRIDELSDGSVLIEDYKTGKAKNENFAKYNLQLTIYAMAAKRQGMKPGRVSIYNLENDSVIEVERSESDLKAGEKKILKAARGIRDGVFEPKPGFGCRYCAYAPICPAKEERVLALTQAVGAVQ